jgi:hypothetical protein
LQPTDERNAQGTLPVSKDSLWATLLKTKVKMLNQGQSYTATFPDDVKKLDGQTVKVSGFILPLESTEKFKHFLLSKRTPTCFYCPPGEPNEIVEVFADKATEWDDGLVTYEGKFSITAKSDKGIFFTLINAKNVK